MLIQAKSVEEKRLWAQQIKRLILENHNTVVPQKVKSFSPPTVPSAPSQPFNPCSAFTFEGERGNLGHSQQ